MRDTSIARTGLNIANVSWGDHLEWGAGSARLATPDDVARSVERWVERDGKWLTISVEDVDRAQAWFRRHGHAAVFFGRLVPGVRTFVSLPAGFSAMPRVPFLFYSALGTVVWTAALAYAGVLLQANLTIIGDYMNLATNILIGGLAVLLIRRYVKCWTAD